MQSGYQTDIDLTKLAQAAGAMICTLIATALREVLFYGCVETACVLRHQSEILADYIGV